MVNQNKIDKTLDRLNKSYRKNSVELALKLAEYCNDDNYTRILNALFRSDIYTVEKLNEANLDSIYGLGEHSKNVLRQMMGLETKQVKHYDVAWSKMSEEELIELRHLVDEALNKMHKP